jgi:hypothetical protein
MQDVTEAFLRARTRGAWPIERVVDAVRDGSGEFAGLRCEWEDGEDWVRILKTSMVLSLVWVPGPLVIATTGHHEIDDEIEGLCGISVEQVNVAHLDQATLSLRTDAIPEIWPGVEWPTNAVDPACFSPHDLWYATC